MKIELTELQAKMLYIACNSQQHMALNSVAHAVERLGEEVPEVWMEEFDKEFKTLQEIKDKLGWDKDE